MRISSQLAFASRFSAVVAEPLISQHAPCNKLLFLVRKFNFRWNSKSFSGLYQIPQKGWDSPDSF